MVVFRMYNALRRLIKNLDPLLIYLKCSLQSLMRPIGAACRNAIGKKRMIESEEGGIMM